MILFLSAVSPFCGGFEIHHGNRRLPPRYQSSKNTNIRINTGLHRPLQEEWPHMKKVAVIMGSKSDLPTLAPCFEQLRALGIPYEAHVYSAHRTPDLAAAFAAGAAQNGFGAIIAATGKAAHLAGALAARTVLPVIGIPVKASTLDGLDALLSTVQMPAGIPVATVAIDGAANAAILAAQILAVSDPALTQTLLAFKEDMRLSALQKDSRLVVD